MAMTEMGHRRKVLGLALAVGFFVSLGSSASACVVTYRPGNEYASTQLMNNCPFPVVVSYCQGAYCEPGKPYMRLSRGQSVFMPDGHIRWVWCNANTYNNGRGQCR
jgi:hypothetical protein